MPLQISLQFVKPEGNVGQLAVGVWRLHGDNDGPVIGHFQDQAVLVDAREQINGVSVRSCPKTGFFDVHARFLLSMMDRRARQVSDAGSQKNSAGVRCDGVFMASPFGAEARSAMRRRNDRGGDDLGKTPSIIRAQVTRRTWTGHPGGSVSRPDLGDFFP